MTKSELKIVMYIIDSYTKEKEDGYCGVYGYSKYIDEKGIRDIKNRLVSVFDIEDKNAL